MCERERERERERDWSRQTKAQKPLKERWEDIQTDGRSESWKNDRLKLTDNDIETMWLIEILR